MCDTDAPGPGPRLTFYNNVNNGTLSITFAIDTIALPVGDQDSNVFGYEDLDFDSGNSDSASLGSSPGAGHTIDASGNDHGSFTYYNSTTNAVVAGFFMVKEPVRTPAINSQTCVTAVVVI